MALNIDTSALQTLKAFNEFAAVMGSDSKAVAAVEVGKDGQIQVRLDYGDKAYALRRSNEQKQINRTVRDTLADAVAKLFNGADNVPESVAKELRLSDHAAGKPLTARRIAKIQTAIAKELIHSGTIIDGDKEEVGKDMVLRGLGRMAGEGGVESSDVELHRVYTLKEAANINKKYSLNLSQKRPENLPQEILDAVEDVQNAINGRCGEGTVNDFLSTLLFAGSATKEFDKAIDGLDHPITREEASAALLKGLKESGAVETKMLMARMDSFSTEFPKLNVSRAAAEMIFKSVPGLKEELSTAMTPNDIKATLDKFEAQIKKRMEVMEYLDELGSIEVGGKMFIEELARATGKSADEISAMQPPLTKLLSKHIAEGLNNKIESGEVAANTKEDVKAGATKIFQDLAATYASALKDVDDIPNLTDKARNALKLSVIQSNNLKEFNVKVFSKLAAKIDISSLKTAMLKQPFDLDAATSEYRTFLKSLFKIGNEGVGQKAWEGFDSQVAGINIMLKCALSGEDELVQALNTHNETFNEKLSSAADGYIGGVRFAMSVTVGELA